jgi:hypothetical protein
MPSSRLMRGSRAGCAAVSTGGSDRSPGACGGRVGRCGRGRGTEIGRQQTGLADVMARTATCPEHPCPTGGSRMPRGSRRRAPHQSPSPATRSRRCRRRLPSPAPPEGASGAPVAGGPARSDRCIIVLRSTARPSALPLSSGHWSGAECCKREAAKDAGVTGASRALCGNPPKSRKADQARRPGQPFEPPICRVLPRLPSSSC